MGVMNFNYNLMNACFVRAVSSIITETLKDLKHGKKIISNENFTLYKDA
jgi:hypothetical protein